ncbi:MAG: hypothetical protein GY714_15825 [Desulfobacterales bacterium]|nr:hypothetical protein [Desulfobacterales bacterium]
MKNPNDLAVILNVRKNSTRCENKLLRNFAGTTLFDIIVEKLHLLDWPQTYLGANEDIFKEKAKKACPNIKIINRSHESANVGSGTNLVFEMYKEIDHKWVFWINACHAHLKVDTIKKAIDEFLKIDNNSMTSVKPYLGWFYSQDGTPMNNKNCYTGVNTDDFIYVGAHAFHAYLRETPLTSDKVWDNVKGDPYVYPISEDESFDVDTEEDFIISEALYKHKTIK